MSTQVLHIDSSILGDNSVSGALGKTLTDALSEKLVDVSVIHRDLGQDPVPYLDGATFAAMGEGKAELSNQLIEELLAADIIVIGAPMYNFGIPAQLKSWLDHLARAGTTFKYTSEGPVGLVSGKKVFVLAARGGAYRDTPLDTHTPYLKSFLGFLGISDVEFIYAEGLAMGEEARANTLTEAEAAIAAAVESLTIA
ncbi:FMN-dependent NADH-azoreductase [Teredinibacter turnerae]|uniref:FMN-dependent NADH-azoreductase n=1 Tax=Teredinibacter turnerae TaxID=2426 RepID=UPI000364720F|nr:NAD(P)H-dependent oxidoreductase [Teredinibacter turnerae]